MRLPFGEVDGVLHGGRLFFQQSVTVLPATDPAIYFAGNRKMPRFTDHFFAVFFDEGIKGVTPVSWLLGPWYLQNNVALSRHSRFFQAKMPGHMDLWFACITIDILTIHS